MVRRGREARGLDERVELGTGDGIGQERPDRPPRLDERGNAPGHHRNRSSAGGRTSSRTEPSRNHPGSRPRTIATGTLRRLAHHELGGAGDLVGDRDLGDLELAAERVGWPRRSTTAAIPATPIATSVSPWRHGAAERVGDDDGHVDAGVRPDRVADVLGRPVGVDREQRGLPVVDVRQVDPGVRAHEAVAGLADDEVAAAPQDAHRLRLDQRAARVRDRRDRAARAGLRPSTRPSA